MADKWIAARPGTDAALAEAIAYVWLDEETYDKKFIEGRTLGFDEFKKHILGKTDGIKRTPDGRGNQGVRAYDLCPGERMGVKTDDAGMRARGGFGVHVGRPMGTNGPV